MATDPVCGMSVEASSAELTLLREGRTYYFCSSTCLAEFSDPDRAERRLARRLAVGWPLAIAVVLLVYAFRFPGAAFAELALAAVVQGYVGLEFYRGAWDALRTRVPNMDLLVATGSSLAFGYSVAVLALPGRLPSVEFFDASSLILTLLLTGHFLELKTRRRASSALLRLNELLPARVEVVRGGRTLTCAPEEVGVGDVATVPPGGRVPADGPVVAGTSEVDESLLTGEPRPVPKGPGGSVIAGSLNGPGRLEIRAEKVGASTFLAEVGRLLSEAESSRMPLRRTADRLSERFVPLVFGIAAVAAIGWALAGAGIAIVVLVLVSVVITACPCAFGLATPAAILAGTGRAAEEGVLFRGAEALERAAAIDVVLMDKTGTITSARPELARVRAEPGWTESELLAVASGLEATIAHPFARAIVGSAREKGLTPAPVSGVVAVPGRVSGMWNGRPVSIEAEGSNPDSAGPSASVIRVAGAPAGHLQFRETLAPGAREAVDRLRRDGRRVVMVTGDRAEASARIGRSVGITEVHAGLTPAGKLEILRREQALGHRVAFVGDGVNDAPALAAADLGMALATGPDVAQEAGQVLLVRPGLDGVVVALEVGSRTVAKVRQNLGWAVGYNAVLLPVAAGALVPLAGTGLFYALPIVGAAAMGLSSTIVLVNSLGLRRLPRGASGRLG